MTIKKAQIIYQPELSSTNEHAREMLQKARPEEYTTIIAGYQTNGRGQSNNNWESNAGENILMTMVIFPHWVEITRQFSLSMAVALGISDLLHEEIPTQDILIKWPNDIYIADRKIAGILINSEVMGSTFDNVLAGIGLNVNQTAFSRDIPNPTSLKLITGRTEDPVELAEKLAVRIIDRIELLKADKLKIISDYHKNLLGIGVWRDYIHLGKNISAKITGVNKFGHLELDTAKGRITCDLKEIEYLF